MYRQDGDGPHSPVTALLFAPRFEDRTLPPEGAFSYSVTAIDLSGNESDWSNIAPPPLDFFGSVLEVRRNFAGDGTLAVATRRGRVDVAVSTDTEVWVPSRPNADLRHIEVGDYVAVSLIEGTRNSVARQVHLIPTKTRNRHLAGRVSRLLEDSIEIQPLEENSEPTTFQLTESVRIKLSPGADMLSQGQFVVASLVASDGQTAATLLEINVIPGPVTPGDLNPPEEQANVAEVRGIFQGINPLERQHHSFIHRDFAGRPHGDDGGHIGWRRRGGGSAATARRVAAGPPPGTRRRAGAGGAAHHPAGGVPRP